jgi:hypothetical protein
LSGVSNSSGYPCLVPAVGISVGKVPETVQKSPIQASL